MNDKFYYELINTLSLHLLQLLFPSYKGHESKLGFSFKSIWLQMSESVELESCFAECGVGVKRQMCVGVCIQYHKVLLILSFSGIKLVLAHAPLRSGNRLGSATKIGIRCFYMF